METTNPDPPQLAPLSYKTLASLLLFLTTTEPCGGRTVPLKSFTPMILSGFNVLPGAAMVPEVITQRVSGKFPAIEL